MIMELRKRPAPLPRPLPRPLRQEAAGSPGWMVLGLVVRSGFCRVASLDVLRSVCQEIARKAARQRPATRAAEAQRRRAAQVVRLFIRQAMREVLCAHCGAHCRRRCARCGLRYCCLWCQEQDWPRHKAFCRRGWPL